MYGTYQRRHNLRFYPGTLESTKYRLTYYYYHFITCVTRRTLKTSIEVEVRGTFDNFSQERAGSAHRGFRHYTITRLLSIISNHAIAIFSWAIKTTVSHSASRRLSRYRGSWLHCTCTIYMRFKYLLHSYCKSQWASEANATWNNTRYNVFWLWKLQQWRSLRV